MIIKQNLIPLGHPNRRGDKINPIAVVIHFTGNDSPTASAINNIKYISRAYKNINGKIYENNGKDLFRHASAQWFIDENEAILAIPQNEVAWACGDRSLSYDNGYKGQTRIAKEIFDHKQNYLTINYELCNNANWEKTCSNSIPIIVKDMIDYKIDKNMVFRHYDVTGKWCPGPFIKNNHDWEVYKKRIMDEYIKQTTQDPVNPDPTKPWQQVMGEKAIDSLTTKGKLSNPEYWKKRNLKDEPAPLWLVFEMLDRFL